MPTKHARHIINPVINHNPAVIFRVVLLDFGPSKLLVGSVNYPAWPRLAGLPPMVSSTPVSDAASVGCRKRIAGGLSSPRAIISGFTAYQELFNMPMRFHRIPSGCMFLAEYRHRRTITGDLIRSKISKSTYQNSHDQNLLPCRIGYSGNCRVASS